LMLQKIYMLHTTFTHVTAEIFTARLPSDARRPDASSPFTKSNGQYMAMSWPHTPPSWPCPGHILLHPDRYSSPLFSLQYGSLHLSILKHNTTVCLVCGLIFFEEIHRLILAWLECGTWPVQTYPILAINPYLVFFC